MFKYASDNKIKGTFVLQQSTSDCGVACLASLINYHGGDFSLNTIRELSNAISEGPTLLGLYQAAQQLGYDAEGLQATSAKDLIDFNDSAILHVIIKKTKHHFLVFYGYENGKLIIGDPAKGIVNYTYEELDKIWHSKSLLKLKPNDSFVKRKLEKGEKKKFLADIISGDLKTLMSIALLSIAITLTGVLAVLSLKDLIDEIVIAGNQQNIRMEVSIIALLCFGCSTLIYMKNILSARQGMNFNKRLVERFYNRVLRLPKSLFDLKSGEFITHKNDVRLLQTSVGIISNEVLVNVLSVVVSSAIIFMYSTTITFVALMSIPLHLLMYYLLNGRLLRTQKKLIANRALAEIHYADSVNSITTIKSLTKEDYFTATHSKIFGSFQKKLFSVNNINSRFNFFSQVVSIVLAFAIAGLSVQMTLTKVLTTGEMIVVLLVAGSTIYGVHKLALANSVVQEAILAFNRLYDFVNLKIENYNPGSFPSGPDQNAFFKEAFRIRFKNVSFRFPGRKKLLRSISFKLKRGELISFLSESGSGKSTLIQILQKFYKPKSGKIEINSIDLAKIQVKPWRNILGVVPQEIKIFNDTLLYNLTLNNNGDEMDDVIEFCQYYGFDRYFEQLPQSYLTKLGNEGINISGAQKQLVGLARALYRKPDLLLLDEAMSSMDPKMEKFVFDLLARLKSTMATLMVTSRASIAQKTDRVYLLEKGELSIFGSPNALMLTENIFSESIKSDEVTLIKVG